MESSHQYKQGCKVFARCRNDPFWPAKIVKILSEAHLFEVQFYNHNTTAFVYQKDLLPFNADNIKKQKKVNHNKMKQHKMFQKTRNMIIKGIRIALEQPENIVEETSILKSQKICESHDKQRQLTLDFSFENMRKRNRKNEQDISLDQLTKKRKFSCELNEIIIPTEQKLETNQDQTSRNSLQQPIQVTQHFDNVQDRNFVQIVKNEYETQRIQIRQKQEILHLQSDPKFTDHQQQDNIINEKQITKQNQKVDPQSTIVQNKKGQQQISQKVDRNHIKQIVENKQLKVLNSNANIVDKRRMEILSFLRDNIKKIDENKKKKVQTKLEQSKQNVINDVVENKEINQVETTPQNEQSKYTSGIQPQKCDSQQVNQQKMNQPEQQRQNNIQEAKQFTIQKVNFSVVEQQKQTTKDKKFSLNVQHVIQSNVQQVQQPNNQNVKQAYAENVFQQANCEEVKIVNVQQTEKEEEIHIQVPIEIPQSNQQYVENINSSIDVQIIKEDIQKEAEQKSVIQSHQKQEIIDPFCAQLIDRLYQQKFMEKDDQIKQILTPQNERSSVAVNDSSPQVEYIQQPILKPIQQNQQINKNEQFQEKQKNILKQIEPAIQQPFIISPFQTPFPQDQNKKQQQLKESYQVVPDIQDVIDFRTGLIPIEQVPDDQQEKSDNFVQMQIEPNESPSIQIQPYSIQFNVALQQSDNKQEQVSDNSPSNPVFEVLQKKVGWDSQLMNIKQAYHNEFTSPNNYPQLVMGLPALQKRMSQLEEPLLINILKQLLERMIIYLSEKQQKPSILLSMAQKHIFLAVITSEKLTALSLFRAGVLKLFQKMIQLYEESMDQRNWVCNYMAEYLMIKAKLEYFSYFSKDVDIVDEVEENKQCLSYAYA